MTLINIHHCLYNYKWINYIACVNFSFFIAVPSGGGCWYYVKCEMLLCHSEMNMQKYGFSAKWRRWRYALRLTATAVVTDSRCRFSKRWHVADVKDIAGDNKATLMVDRNSANITHTFRFFVFTSTRSWLLFRGWRQLPQTRSIGFQRDDTLPTSKLHWKWPDNPNGRSKFSNLHLFTLTISQLTLCGWQRLTENAQTAHSRRQNIACNEKDRSKFHKYENLCLRDQVKPLKKHLFAARTQPLRLHCKLLFFSYYHSHRLLLSPTKYNFSMTLTLTEKPRYTYWRVFFCRFYL